MRDLEGVSDAVRLAVLVLASRTPSETGVVEIRTSELGRWLGVSASYVASAVLPVLRRSGVVSVDTAEGEFGQDDGLECRVLPLWAAQDVVGHPLNLSRKELAVVLRLLEAVMAPGWRHRDGRVTPAGLLGSRTGRGAATDRLALLLLVLEARETGRVRQCGGRVDTRRGRAAATVARLLGCKASAGERVLERLEDRGLVRRVRVQTVSGLAHRTRLLVPAVAAAHGRAVAGGVRENRAEALQAGSSAPDVAAGAGEDPEAETEPQFSGVPVTVEADVAEPDAAAALHTDHPDVVAEAGEGADVGGFSGYGREGSGDLPGRAGAREGEAGDRARRLTRAGGSGGPLRGERQPSSLCPQRTGSESGQAVDVAWAEAGRDAAAGRLAGMGGCSGSGLRGRVPRPRGDLRVALAPVEVLWDRLKGAGSRGVVEKTARRELRRVADWLGEDRAEQYLAERLTRRLTAQRGRAFGVKDPVGWLLERGLPRRSDCGDLRCDEGVLMHTGAACALCEDVVLDLRARRRRVAAEVEAGLPGAASAQRREVFEGRLREVVAADAARCRARRREQEAQAAASQAGAAEIRARREAQEAARRAMPCAQCSMPRAGGLCPVCREQGETEKLIEQAVAFVAGGCSGLGDPAMASALAASAETEARTRIQDACAQLEAAGGTELTIALAGRGTAELIVHEYRATALRMLGCGSEAEARSAHAAQLRRRHLHPCAEAAGQAAEQAAAEARSRVAEHLLAQRATAWLTARTQGPEVTPGLQERSAAYAAGAARARAAAAAHPAQGSAVRPARELLARPEPDVMKAAAEAEETARLRAQIAAQMPELAAVTAAHHGVTYDMSTRPAAGAGS